MKCKRPEEALTHYARLAAIRPKRKTISASLHALNRQIEAIAHFRKALVIRPDYAYAHANLGLALESLGRIEEATRAFEKAIKHDADCVTDKMPSNFRFAGLIHLALPNARIIHTRRNPVDTCVSCFSTLFARGQPFAYELGELGRYYRAYERLMDHWRAVLPEGVMFEVRYEELVADFEGQARRIVAHCGLAWDEACLAFNKTQRPVKSASAPQVYQPLYIASVGRGSCYGDLLRPLLDALS
jgi:tetratricopeptide (TPR) repeat protein